MIDKEQARRHFSQAAKQYDELAVLQQQTGAQLLQRLEYILHQPQRILDIGSGTGIHSQGLQKLYPKAQVIALDFALPMLQQSQKQKRLFNKVQHLCADLEYLPLQDKSIDLIYSNAALQWSNQLEHTFKEWARVLHSGGLLMFSTFGPATLYELKKSWQAVENNPESEHVSQFKDIHEIGDLLLQSGFSEPVIDTEKTTLMYSSVHGLMRDLKGIGATNAQTKRRKGLTGKNRFKKMYQAYEQYRQADGLPATYEIIYGQAWISSQSIKKNSQRVSIKQLKAV